MREYLKERRAEAHNREEMDRQNKTRVHEPVDQAKFEQLEYRFLQLQDQVNSYLAGINSRMNALENTSQLQPDSDGWIPWEGGECPVNEEVIVEVIFRSRNGGRDIAGNYSWGHTKSSKGMPGSADIIAYRPAKQEAQWPQVGDTYWTVGSCLETFMDYWNDDSADRERRAGTGIYPTREQAEEAAAKIKRVMEHWRDGGTVDLIPGRYTALGQGIKL